MAIMSSPIVHIAAGYAIYSIVRHKLPKQSIIGVPARIGWPILFACLSLLPDLDVIVAWTHGNMAKFHNNLTHSLLVWIPLSLLLAAVLKACTEISARCGFLFFLVSSYMHILVDFSTYGRGVMLFWPITTTRFHAPITIFQGVPWSDKLTSPNYLQMLLEDCFFAAIVLALVAIIRRFHAWHEKHAYKPGNGIK